MTESCVLWQLAPEACQEMKKRIALAPLQSVNEMLNSVLIIKYLFALTQFYDFFMIQAILSV